MKLIFIALLLALSATVYSQIGIGTPSPNASAQLDVFSSTKGFLAPRVALTSTDAASPITTPATGLLVYNTATAGTSPTNVTPGFYYYNGASWDRISTGAGGVTGLDGLTDVKYEGTNFTNSLLIGSKTTGTLNAASGNTGVGKGVFSSLTTGNSNAALGFEALKNNTSGIGNTASGYFALKNNTTANGNTAAGNQALSTNTTGSGNTATGQQALLNNNSDGNTATGDRALVLNTNGAENTASGRFALTKNTIGSYNTASGIYALGSNTEGSNNTASGNRALYTNTTGSNNTAIGNQADVFTAALTNATAIGYGAVVNASHTIQLGNSAVTNVATAGTLTLGTVTYPNADGIAGQVLRTNGSGTIGWANLSGLAIPYTGATGAVNLGAYDLTVNSLTIGKGAGAGGYNTAIGTGALRGNQGSNNTAVGSESQYAATGMTGNDNTSLGSSSLYYNQIGSANTGIGYQSLFYNEGSNNTAIGNRSLFSNYSGNYNTAIGYSATVGGDSLVNATAIGNGAIVDASNKIQLGNSSVTSVVTSGTITAAGNAITSDARLKTNFNELDGGLNTVLQLHPYSYEKKSTIASEDYTRKEIGFKAQDIQAILPDLVTEGSDADKTLSVNYTALIPVLTKAIQEQQEQIAELKKLLNQQLKKSSKKSRVNKNN